MTKCEKCGMEYVPEVEGDQMVHRGYHDKVVFGIRASLLRSDRVIWKRKNERITVVDEKSPITQKNRAERITNLEYLETKYSLPYGAHEPPDARNVHVFLYYVSCRGVGFLLVEKCKFIWRCTWDEYAGETSLERYDHPPIWSVGRIWVHRQHRQRGRARRLVEQAARYLAIKVDSLGWNTPFTKDGEAIARHLCPNSFYIGKPGPANQLRE